jgi:hypothetical protein
VITTAGPAKESNMASAESRRGGRFRSWAVNLAALVGVAAVALVVLGQFFSFPFSTKTRDHSAPPILLELRNLSEYHAAQAQLEVTIDREDDVAWMPSFLAGERVQYIAVGTVDGVVDFSGLSASAIQVSADGDSVVVSLPAPYLTEPVIDTDVSHVMNRDRGLVNRLTGLFLDNPTSERSLVLMAEEKLAAAAAATNLLELTQTNTTAMLVAMLRSLGFEQVEVRFEVAWAHADSTPDDTTTTTAA